MEELDDLQRWKIYCNVDFSLTPDALQELKNIADVSVFTATQENLLENIHAYDAYFASAHVQVNKEVLENAKNLKVIASPGTGTDHIDILEATQKGIEVLHIAHEQELLKTFTATAEIAWGLLISCIRQLPAAFDCAKNGYWARERFTGFQLYGKTIGIVGMGRLGTMIANYANSFGMTILGCDVEQKYMPIGRQVTLEELVSASDVVSINVHLTENTRGLVSSDLIRAMKPGVVIVNTSRGAVIDEQALLDNLNKGHIGAAGLDVIDGEWSRTIYDHPLIQYSRSNSNLIISPHIGGATVESIIGARVFLVTKLVKYIKRKSLIRASNELRKISQ